MLSIVQRLVDTIDDLVVNIEKRHLNDEEKLGLMNRSEDELVEVILFLETRDEPELDHLY